MSLIGYDDRVARLRALFNAIAEQNDVSFTLKGSQLHLSQGGHDGFLTFPDNYFYFDKDVHAPSFRASQSVEAGSQFILDWDHPDSNTGAERISHSSIKFHDDTGNSAVKIHYGENMQVIQDGAPDPEDPSDPTVTGLYIDGDVVFNPGYGPDDVWPQSIGNVFEEIWHITGASKIEENKEAAEAAATAAETAQGAAELAQTTADGALGAAEAAQTTADIAEGHATTNTAAIALLKSQVGDSNGSDSLNDKVQNNRDFINWLSDWVVGSSPNTSDTRTSSSIHYSDFKTLSTHMSVTDDVTKFRGKIEVNPNTEWVDSAYYLLAEATVNGKLFVGNTVNFRDDDGSSNFVCHPTVDFHKTVTFRKAINYIEQADNSLAQIATLNDVVSPVDHSNLEARVTDLENDMGSAQSDITVLENDSANQEARITQNEEINGVQDGRLADLENQMTSVRQITDLITYDDSDPTKIELDFDRTDVKTLTIDDRMNITNSALLNCPGTAAFEGLLTFTPDPGFELAADENSTKIPNTEWVRTRINTDLATQNTILTGLIQDEQTARENADTALSDRVQANENEIGKLEDSQLIDIIEDTGVYISANRTNDTYPQNADTGYAITTSTNKNGYPLVEFYWDYITTYTSNSNPVLAATFSLTAFTRRIEVNIPIGLDGTVSGSSRLYRLHIDSLLTGVTYEIFKNAVSWQTGTVSMTDVVTDLLKPGGHEDAINDGPYTYSAFVKNIPISFLPDTEDTTSTYEIYLDLSHSTSISYRLAYPENGGTGGPGYVVPPTLTFQYTINTATETWSSTQPNVGTNPNIGAVQLTSEIYLPPGSLTFFNPTLHIDNTNATGEIEAEALKATNGIFQTIHADTIKFTGGAFANVQLHIEQLENRIIALETLTSNMNRNQNTGQPDVVTFDCDVRVLRDMRVEQNMQVDNFLDVYNKADFREDVRCRKRVDVDDELRLKESGSYHKIEIFVGNYWNL